MSQKGFEKHFDSFLAVVKALSEGNRAMGRQSSQCLKTSTAKYTEFQKRFDIAGLKAYVTGCKESSKKWADTVDQDTYYLKEMDSFTKVLGGVLKLLGRDTSVGKEVNSFCHEPRIFTDRL